MKLTIVLLTAVFTNVCATGVSQNITFSGTNVPLESVFYSIKKQTDFVFIYTDPVLRSSKPVTIKAEGIPLEQFLSEIFKSQPLQYEIKYKNIIISLKPVTSLSGRQLNTSGTDVLYLVDALIDVRGRVVDEKGDPIPGATVTVKGKNIGISTDDEGRFFLKGVDENAILSISSINYVRKEIRINKSTELNIALQMETKELKEVSVKVNTGYQELDNTRSTGSFYKLDQKTFDRKVGIDVLSRLDGVSSGVLFDKRVEGTTNIQIRGLSTLMTEIAQPLIVLDNFPYAGDIANINPNDIESITILKDAAAASIWGARAGNGVIVLTSKKGTYNQPIKVSLNSNITLIDKPDLFNIPQINSSDYIDMETLLFQKGYYNSEINNRAKPPLSNVVEILLAQRNGLITQFESEERINLLRGNDVRKDFEKYIYRQSVNQQYSLNLNGGSSIIKYLFSVGFDKSLTTLVGNELNRLTVKSENSIKLLPKLELQFGLIFTRGETERNSPGAYNAAAYKLKNRIMSPYAKLADENGTPTDINTKYRQGFIDTAGRGQLNDWKYRPLDELKYNDNTSQSNDILANIALNYSLYNTIRAEVRYQYERTNAENRVYYNNNSFFTRDLVNLFTQINSGNVIYQIPNAGILDLNNTILESNSFRGQISFNRSWNDRHSISAIGGAEAREVKVSTNAYRTYGFDETLNSTSVDYVTIFPTYGNVGGQRTIPSLTDFTSTLTRYTSLFSNFSYTYNERYTISGSIRKDASNLFGVNANNKGVPLWSAGASWNISREGIVPASVFPYLNLRVTYGHSGNINNSATALTTISYNPASWQITNIPFANVANSPNPDLRWEKVGQFNIGLDFTLRNNRVNGSLEYYRKKSKDVFGFEKIEPTTGISILSTNSANISGSGIDVQLRFKIIDHSKFEFETNFLFSRAAYKVTKYLDKNLNDQGFFSDGTSIVPIEGYNPYALISYRWAGLDSETGDPIGILNGKPSKNYDSIAYYTQFSDQVYNKTALPTYFGNILNTITWHGISVSTNFTYRLDYHFRRSTISYGSLYRGQSIHADYVKRWQKPGDELITQVPSMVYPSNEARNQFYTYSEATVEKGDHIRFEDIRLSYTMDRSKILKLPFNSIQLYAYISNLNIILWKSNDAGLDPNYPGGLRPSRSFAFGFRSNF